MKRLISTLTIALTCTALLPGAAQADFDLNNFKVTFTNEDGTAATEAGSHPFAMTTSFGVNFSGEGTSAVTEGRIKDAFVEQIAGFAGDATAYPRCATIDFIVLDQATQLNDCPVESAVGIAGTSAVVPTNWFASPIFNLVPPPGVATRLGFRVVNQNVVVDVGVNPDTNNIFATSRNISQQEYVYGSKIELWGNPSDPAHDRFRGRCAGKFYAVPVGEELQFVPSPICSLPASPRGPFLTLPTRCEGQNLTTYAGSRWEQPGAILANGQPDLTDPNWVTGGFETPSFNGCEALGFSPSIEARPTSRAAQSPTGLDFSLRVEDEGIKIPTGRAQSQVKEAVVTLPVGMSANPSLAEGLEVCSEAQLAKESADSAPGEGCPEASKIGTIEVKSPLVDETLSGALYQATPFANRTEDSLLAFYIVIKSPELGILVIQPVKVEPDPQTGQLVAITKDIPQLPFSEFKLHFREGGRSPLVSPPSCGSHAVKALLTPWSGTAPITSISTFQITSGPGERPCPTLPGPFAPGFEAGSTSNAAGHFSPFTMRLTRKDAEQDMSRFSATLPPGMVAKLAGTSQCSDAQIAAAKAKSGLQEKAAPSCPADSQIGHVIGGAGAGSQLTYVQGTLYIAGPINGAPLSVVAIVPAVAGPFDVGNVVVRQALRVDPRTARVSADGSASDPLPRILAGIPLNVRDIRVYVDRPQFTLNPTSCEESAVSALMQGSGGALAEPASRYQAAACASLGFRPRLKLRLKGGTKRGAHPALRGVFRPRAGDANLEQMVLRLPRSTFLDQAHIRTICTRVQFAAAGGNGAGCPPGAIYGKATAYSPLLAEPLSGPVFLRSSDNELPDFVAALSGIIDVEAVARIDSQRGGIRATFTDVPDAPLTKVIVEMQGAKKGLIVNSTDLCKGKHRANARMSGHNGRTARINPLLGADCAKRK